MINDGPLDFRRKSVRLLDEDYRGLKRVFHFLLRSSQAILFTRHLCRMGAAEIPRASAGTLIAGARMVRDAGSYACLPRGNRRNLRRAAVRARFQTANRLRVEIKIQEPAVAAEVLRPHRAFIGGHRENRLLYLVEPGTEGNVHEFSRALVFGLGNCAVQAAGQRDGLGSSVAGGSNFQVNPCRSEDRRYKTLRRSERI